MYLAIVFLINMIYTLLNKLLCMVNFNPKRGKKMTHEVKALILSFAKELTVREIANQKDFDEVCYKLNLSSIESEDNLFKERANRSISMNAENFNLLD